MPTQEQEVPTRKVFPGDQRGTPPHKEGGIQTQIQLLVRVSGREKGRPGAVTQPTWRGNWQVCALDERDSEAMTK